MSKYNTFARKLSDAVITARREYADAYDALKKAQSESRSVNRSDKVKAAQASANLLAAEETFKQAEGRILGEFNQERGALTAELEKAVKADGTVSPDSVDQNGLELLRSGVLKPDDFYSLMDRYDDNPTMLRLLSKYARDAVEDTDDPATRAALAEVARGCADGGGQIMRAWNTLLELSTYCTGQAHREKMSPSYKISMANRWEDLAGEAVKNF